VNIELILFGLGFPLKYDYLISYTYYESKTNESFMKVPFQ
jgi:hypothetical protein